MTAEKEISIWSRAVLLLLEEKGGQSPSFIAERLLTILKQKKKEYLLEKIIKKVERDYAKKNRIDLFLARDHSQGTQEDLAKRISEIFGEGKKVNVKIKKEIIGGFQIKTDNFLVSASVKDFLNELKIKYIN